MKSTPGNVPLCDTLQVTSPSSSQRYWLHRLPVYLQNACIINDDGERLELKGAQLRKMSRTPVVTAEGCHRASTMGKGVKGAIAARR